MYTKFQGGIFSQANMQNTKLTENSKFLSYHQCHPCVCAYTSTKSSMKFVNYIQYTEI